MGSAPRDQATVAVDPSGRDRPALALPWRDFRPNYQTLLWFAGIYPLILGVSLLLLPDTSVGWNALRHLHGGLSVLSGIALLWAVGTTRS